MEDIIRPKRLVLRKATTQMDGPVSIVHFTSDVPVIAARTVVTNGRWGLLYKASFGDMAEPHSFRAYD